MCTWPACKPTVLRAMGSLVRLLGFSGHGCFSVAECFLQFARSLASTRRKNRLSGPRQFSQACSSRWSCLPSDQNSTPSYSSSWHLCRRPMADKQLPGAPRERTLFETPSPTSTSLPCSAISLRSPECGTLYRTLAIFARRYVGQGLLTQPDADSSQTTSVRAKGASIRPVRGVTPAMTRTKPCARNAKLQTLYVAVAATSPHHS